PVTIKLITIDYGAVDFPKPEILQGSKLTDLAQTQKRSIDTLAQWLDYSYEIRGDLTYVRQHADEFETDPSGSLEAAWAKNELIIQTLIDSAQACRANPQDGCQLPAPPDFPKFLPKRKVGSGGVVVSPPPKYGWVRERGGKKYSKTFWQEVVPQYEQ